MLVVGGKHKERCEKEALLDTKRVHRSRGRGPLPATKGSGDWLASIKLLACAFLLRNSTDMTTQFQIGLLPSYYLQDYLYQSSTHVIIIHTSVRGRAVCSTPQKLSASSPISKPVGGFSPKDTSLYIIVDRKTCSSLASIHAFTPRSVSLHGTPPMTSSMFTSPDSKAYLYEATYFLSRGVPTSAGTTA